MLRQFPLRGVFFFPDYPKMGKCIIGHRIPGLPSAASVSCSRPPVLSDPRFFRPVCCPRIPSASDSGSILHRNCRTGNAADPACMFHRRTDSDPAPHFCTASVPYFPVLPNPLSPLSVSLSSSTRCRCGVRTGVTTSCDIFSPS